MCSRYYIDSDMMEEISRVVQNIDGRIRLTQGDIRPTDVAPVIGQSEHGLELGICRWGYRAGEYTQFGVNEIYRRRSLPNPKEYKFFISNNAIVKRIRNEQQVFCHSAYL